MLSFIKEKYRNSILHTQHSTLIFFILHFLLWFLPTSVSAQAPVYGYKIIKEFPHDALAFTQGFAFDNGFLYEGTGLYGQSFLRRSTLGGKTLEIRNLPNHFFGEGITIKGDRIFQLTWKSRKGLVWQKNSLTFDHFFSYPTEGWGLTNDGSHLIMSDGTSSLFFIDPNSFTLQRIIEVKDNGIPIEKLNELEYIKGEIWANIWKQQRIACIDPLSGRVKAWIDLSGLVAGEKLHHSDNVLNGIAYDAEQNRIFITGKRWPKIFEIMIVGHAKLPLVQSIH